MKTFKQFITHEETTAVAANAVGRGDIAGTVGDPPVSKKKQKEYKAKNFNQSGIMRKMKSL